MGSYQDELAEMFAGVNRTELYQVCRKNGLAVPPGYTKEAYIGWLSRETEPPATTGPIDEWRWGLIHFIDAYWMRLRPQLTCPAKNLKDVPNPNPTPCFGCSDVQVISCITKSSSNEQIISNLRKKRDT